MRDLFLYSSLTGHAPRTQLSDTLEYFLFMGRVSLDRSNQIGNQLVPPLQLRVDVAPGVAYMVSQSNQRIVGQDNINDRQQNDNPDEYKYRHN